MIEMLITYSPNFFTSFLNMSSSFQSILTKLNATEKTRIFAVWGQYTFQLVLLGTIFLGLATSLLGTFNVLKGQSLIGDAIGHSTYPGIILAYMIFITRSPLILSIGASIVGMIAYFLIHLLSERSKLSADTAMAIVLSSFFAFGSVLNANLTTNPRYRNSSQAGLQNYIFGQAADMLKADVIVLMISSIICILFVLICYKEIKITVFDSVYAHCIGFKPNLFNYLLLFFTLILIAQGLKTVGIVLISSLFIAPCIAAQQWTCKLGKTLILSMIFSVTAAVIGVWISSVFSKVSTGPSIVVCLSLIVFISVIFGPRAYMGKLWKRMITTKVNRSLEV